jgi:hypothetical protein
MFYNYKTAVTLTEGRTTSNLTDLVNTALRLVDSMVDERPDTTSDAILAATRQAIAY